MKLSDQYDDKLTVRLHDEGGPLGIEVAYDDSAHGVQAQLAATLNVEAQEEMLREWLALRYRAQGRRDLGLGVRQTKLDVMQLVLDAVAAEVS